MADQEENCTQIALPYKDFQKMLSALCALPHIHALLSDISTDLDTIVNYVESIDLKMKNK